MTTYKIWDADTGDLIATIDGERLTRIVLTELLGNDLKADDVLNSVTPDSLALQYGGYTVLAEEKSRERHYIIDTEDQGEHGWYASLTSGGVPLAGMSGDTESEAITIAVCEALGYLPHDFPRTLINSELESGGTP